MTDFNAAYQIRTMRTALEKIATGEIVGEPGNSRDTLALCRQIAKDALGHVPPEVRDGD